ncbi:DUF898 family protein [Microlunatus soli]|uniref:DUF898 domain-containing protein n=1 Tax=Microlunatus soli TaxID=630515 RepID=A0A1H1U1Y8_9ACTN|nr:DUF898 family protein [Microlunatus soli]SDS66384.1 protein of unknown function [Microlunatus soli]
MSLATPHQASNHPSEQFPGQHAQPGQQWLRVTTQQQLKPFVFDGGAGSYLGMSILSLLLTLVTLGFGAPWAICMKYRWQAEHTLIHGRRVHFTGTGGGLFGNWIKWFLLCIITIGIYGFWVAPKVTKWVVEHQDFS